MSHEFIIAETVPLMRLTPNLPSHECPMSLSLCGTAIPREHGTCEHVLYIASGTESERGQLPISIVPNLATDDRFMRKPYCQFGEAGQFYAAVPIRTRNGINIGSYSVYNTKQPSSWDERSAQSMRDISHAIMDHLEVKRSKNAHRRSERMNRGLGSFIEGKSTLSGWQFGPNVAAFADDHNKEGALDATQQHLEHRHHKKKDDEPEISDTTMEAQDSAPVGPWPSTPIQTSSSAHEAVSPHASPQDSQEPGRPKAPYELAKLRGLSYSAAGTHGVFSKASNIVREAFEVAGCIFFDVTLGSYRSPKVQLSSDENDSDLSTSHQSSTSSGDEQSRALQTETPEAQCHLLGFSTAGASSINHTKLNHNHPRMAKRLLAKLLRRYPNGKIFNYDAVGELQSSDLSEDDDTKHSTTEAVPDYDSKSAEGGVPTGANQKEEARHSSRMEEGALIRSAFPGARSVVFFPVWDSRRERWFAGGFVYTLDPCRVFTSLGDLSFLTAFAKLTAAEIHNIETAQADKAKSDALGALSHELRSPLHGVILSAELLNDTDLTVFQGNATHTIETCCRTLLDTIDHLLDYSKVNSFVTIQKREARGTSSNLRKRRNQSKGIRNKKLHTNIGLDGIVEEVVESVFAGFNFQHMSVRQLSKQGRSAYTDIAALSRQDSAHAMEQLGPTLNDKEQLSLHFGDVLVYVSIDSSCDWKFYLQAGAIRRLVMNLVGNSLKYTEAGAIRVSLSQEPLSSNAPRSERTIKLVVEDTGKGISEDYLQHKLYKPFAQEDELAPGTGLGLSLVKKIVTQLGGRINVKSRVGVGSTFTVTFPLDQSPRAVELSEDDRAFENHIRELAGLRVRLAGFESQGVGGDSGDDSSVINGRTIVESICRETLHLELVDEQTEDIIPDLVIWSDNALPTNNPKDSQLFRVPNIIICQNALVAYQRNNLCNYIRHGGVFEFVSQP